MAGPRPRKVKEFREFLELSQEEFGELLGVAQNTVSSWEAEFPITIDVSSARAMIKLAHDKDFDLTWEHLYGA